MKNKVNIKFYAGLIVMEMNRAWKAEALLQEGHKTLLGEDLRVKRDNSARNAGYMILKVNSLVRKCTGCGFLNKFYNISIVDGKLKESSELMELFDMFQMSAPLLYELIAA